MHGPDPGDAQVLSDPGLVGPAQVVGGADALSGQLPGGSTTYAPDVPHFDILQDSINITTRQEGEHPVMLRVFLGHAVGDLGQGLGGTKADGDRDTGLLPNGVPDVLAGYTQGLLAGQRQPNKRLINGIDLNFGLQAAQYLHDPLGHVAVQGIVGGKDPDPVTLDQWFALEIWLTHLDAQGLGLVGAGDDAAVVVGEHHHRLALKLWVEHPFAGDIEVVAVDQGKESWHGVGYRAWTTKATTPQISQVFPSVMLMSG